MDLQDSPEATVTYLYQGEYDDDESHHFDHMDLQDSPEATVTYLYQGEYDDDESHHFDHMDLQDSPEATVTYLYQGEYDDDESHHFDHMDLQDSPEQHADGIHYGIDLQPSLVEEQVHRCLESYRETESIMIYTISYLNTHSLTKA